MTATDRATLAPPSEAAELAGFGYKPGAAPRRRHYASFAAGFSFVSILTTVFQLFGFGFGFGGPAFFWTWPAGLRRPVAGRAVLRRARRPLADLRVRSSSGRAGWPAPPSAGSPAGSMIIAQILTVAVGRDRHAGRAAGDLVRLPDRRRPTPTRRSTSPTGATNAVLLGSIAARRHDGRQRPRRPADGGRHQRRRRRSRSSASSLLVVAAVLHCPSAARQSSCTHRRRRRRVGYVGALLASSLMAAYVHGRLRLRRRARRRRPATPGTTTPKTILRALAVSGIGGGAADRSAP